MAGPTDEPTNTMDGAQLRELNRSQIQQLARQENIKANIKTEAIISQLLKKYPGGIPTHLMPPSRTKRKRKSTVKRVSVRVSVKQEEIASATPFNEYGVPSQSLPVPPANPQSPSVAQIPEELGPAATLPIPMAYPCNVPSQAPSPGGPDSPTTRGAPPPQRHHVTNPASHVQTPEPPHCFTPPPRSPSPPYLTYHETHEMLRTLTHLINSTSFDPKSTSSIEYKINALDQLLDDKVIPRLMKVDKDVKDMVWVRLALQTECVSRFKEEGVLPAGYMNKKVYNIGPGTSNQHPVTSHEHLLGNKRKRTVDEEPDVSRERSRSRSPSLSLEYPDAEDSPIQKRSRVAA